MEEVAPKTCVAIIGMACRFPGARTVKEFWKNLVEGREGIAFASPEELSRAGVDPLLSRDPNYVPASSTIDNPEYFDASFFGFSARDAEIMDPQQRVFLECAWDALEDAACDPSRFSGLIGVFAGMGMNTYGAALLHRADLLASIGAYQIAIGNDKDFLCSRVAYKLNLRGPAVGIQTACSSSLVAVQVAYASLLRQECDAALAGGVSIPPKSVGYLYTPGMIMSRDGHCRPFDAAASGTVPGAGAGIVVLKRLEDAMRDRDHIYAVIHGAAINNDGAAKVGYSAPSIEGQQSVIRKSMEMAGFEPASIRYIEAHGTGTEVGDPIEFAALSGIFNSAGSVPHSCALGALKSNIGHLDAAAGVAGLIKTALSARHRIIPPTLHFTTPNPLIPLAESPFYVNTSPVSVTADGTFRAGVSSFGIGGTNAHVSLQEAPAANSDSPSHSELIVLSAKTEGALEGRMRQLLQHLDDVPESNLADVAFTLQNGRRQFSFRQCLVAHSVDHLKALLRSAASSPELQRLRARNVVQEPPPIAFLFPGQGAQYGNMGRHLYENAPVFRDAVDHCSTVLQQALGRDLRTILYPAIGDEKQSEELLALTSMTQPAIFTIEYATAMLWKQCGISPAAMIGHSVGEYVAACLAGVFSLDDALHLIAERGRLIQSMPAGAMLAVSLPEQDLRALLPASVSVAAVNSPTQTVASGPEHEIAQLEEVLRSKRIVCKRLRTSHAFHSSMMDPVIGNFVEQVKKTKRNPPRLRWLSNVTGTWITPAQAVDPAYWGDHLRQPVRFADCTTHLLRESELLLLEVGPGDTLSSLIRSQSETPGKRTIVTSLRSAQLQKDDYEHWLEALGKLWLHGVAVEWQGLRQGENRLRVSLPAYPFERQRYWIDPPKASTPSEPTPRKRRDIADWFYVPSWRRSPLPAEKGASAPNWVVFAEGDHLSQELVVALRSRGSVTEVYAGSHFQARSANALEICPERAEDFAALGRHLLQDGGVPDRILYLWKPEAPDCGLLPVMHLLQSFEEICPAASMEVNLVSERGYSIFGEEVASPAPGALHAFCRAASVESPGLRFRIIDIDLSAPSGPVLSQVLEELGTPAKNNTVAYRGRSRWLHSFEPLQIEPSCPASGNSIVLRGGGTYLITGGLGGLGLVLGNHIAKVTKGHIVLLSRSGMPPEDQWASLSESKEWGQKIDAMQSMRASGAVVEIITADVTDKTSMSMAIQKVRQQHGNIHGIIHAAGVSGAGVLQLKSPEHIRQVLPPKVQGTDWIPDALSSSSAPDFVLLCSSLQADCPAPGLTDYAAANAYLNGFAAIHDRRDGPRVIAVNWDSWREVGMAATAEWPAALSKIHEQILNEAIMPAEGIEAFDRILAFPQTQILVSTRDLATLQKQESAAHQLQRDTKSISHASHEPHRTSNGDTAGSQDESEAFVIAVWEELLGTPVASSDNFFELGGHSLMGTQLLSRVRERFGVNLPLRSLFEAPTPAQLAERIRVVLWAAHPPAETPADSEREEIEF